MSHPSIPISHASPGKPAFRLTAHELTSTMTAISLIHGKKIAILGEVHSDNPCTNNSDSVVAMEETGYRYIQTICLRQMY